MGEPRILSDDEVACLESFAMLWSSNPRELAQPCMKLVASHRLLAARVKELEKEHPRHRVIHD